jgi:RNA polymerase sigma factor (sigma-70 family)
LSEERQRGGVDPSEFLALVSHLRPELHRYCARLTGSVMDGEDVVQDSLASAFVALKTLEATPSMRAWLFRIAHNRALDLLRSRALRATEPLEAASETPDSQSVDPLEALMRQDAIKTAVSRFVDLPTAQRSVVILKDVLGHSLEDIAALLDTTVNAVKGHLARGRVRLKAINAEAPSSPAARAPSPEVARFVALFNQRDWEGLRALLARDVKLQQSSHPVRVGAADVGMFFTIYAEMDRVALRPAWLEGREVVAVFEDRDDPKPSYLMWLAWQEGEISFIRDTRYVRYVLAEADLALEETSQLFGAPAGPELA